MRMSLFLLNLILSVMCINCQGVVKSDSGNCKKLYAQANAQLNEYYLRAVPQNLDTALIIIEKNINACPEYEVKMVDMKIRILILLKAYDRGYKYIDSLDTKKFAKSYKKNLYLKSFKAMKAENSRDTINENMQYREIINEVTEYIKSHPEDKEAISDLFFIKAKVEILSKVLEDLDLMRRHNNSDSLFFNSLETAITESQVATPAIQGD